MYKQITRSGVIEPVVLPIRVNQKFVSTHQDSYDLQKKHGVVSTYVVEFVTFAFDSTPRQMP